MELQVPGAALQGLLTVRINVLHVLRLDPRAFHGSGEARSHALVTNKMHGRAGDCLLLSLGNRPLKLSCKLVDKTTDTGLGTR